MAVAEDPELELIVPGRQTVHVEVCSAGGKAINAVTGECACCSD